MITTKAQATGQPKDLSGARSRPATCLVTSWSELAKRFKAHWGERHIRVIGSLADLVADCDYGVFIVDTKVQDFKIWPAPLLMNPDAGSKVWLFLISELSDAASVKSHPSDSIFFERRIGAIGELATHLKNRLAPESRERIERADYVADVRTFIVRMQNGRIYALGVDDLPEADTSSVTRWTIGRSRRYFRVTQESGNWFEVPWDHVLYHCEPEYEYYKGRQKETQDADRAIRIGNKVRRLRIARRLTITELAQRIGMQRPNLSRLEHGRHIPSLETLEGVADALDASVSELVARETQAADVA